MRSAVALSAFLLVTAFAGCFGGDDEPKGDTNENTIPDVIPIREALGATITSTNTKQWIAPGTVYPVALTPPTNAVGNITYSWGYGPMPDGTSTVAMNTNLILPAAAASLEFPNAGVFKFHCHPHPFMLHNVVVLEGYESPAEVTVYIEDSDVLGDYRYSPENLVIGAGTTVVYQNAGDQPHTATLSTAEPGITPLDITGASGDVVLEGDGWMRIVALATDEEGRVGIAEKHLYVKALPANYVKTVNQTFNLSNPDGVPAEVEEPSESQHALGYAGNLTVELTVAQPVADQEVNLVTVTFKFPGTGIATPVIASEPTGSAVLTGMPVAGNYVLIIDAVQGAAFDVTAVVTVVYDPAPPPMPGMDGHAHQH